MRARSPILTLLMVSRPLLWLLQPLVFLIGLRVAQAPFSWQAILQIVLLSFPFSLIMYGINDVYDHDADRKNPRKRKADGMLLEKKQHRLVMWTAFFFSALLLLSALLTNNTENVVAMVICLFVAFAYSAPPLRLKNRPPLDSIANGFYFLGPFALGMSFGTSLWSMPLKFFLVTLGVIGIHAYSTIMDYTADKHAGQRTFSVVFGKRAAAICAMLLLVLIILFGKFSLLNKIYVSFCALLAIITAVFPEEKLARSFLLVMLLGFVLSVLAYLLV
ncbi:MAG: UbiA family prenyltransferase [archaeon]